jgi:hypothetical protein
MRTLGFWGERSSLLPGTALLVALVLLVIPSVPLGASALLAAVGVGVPLVRWVHCFLDFDCDFEGFRLTEEELSEGLDW